MLVLLSITLQNDSNECEKIDVDMCSDCWRRSLISTYQVSNIVQGKNLLCFSGLQCYWKIFILFQSQEIPSANDFKLYTFDFSDFELTDDDTILASIQLMQELDFMNAVHTKQLVTFVVNNSYNYIYIICVCACVCVIYKWMRG